MPSSLAKFVIITFSFNISAITCFPITSRKTIPNSLNEITDFLQQKLNILSDVDQQVNKTVDTVVPLTSSTEARTFYVPPGQAGTIIASSFQILTRLGSGALAKGYKVSIMEKDDSSYSILSIGNYQINEACSPSITKYAPPKPIELYEFEGCPYCCKVREAVSILCLKVLYKPCPKGGPTFRKEIKEKFGSKATFPFMVDPNTGVQMFQSDDIITYLFQRYGENSEDTAPSQLLGLSAAFTAAVGSLPRLGKGSRYKSSNPPSKPLIFWAYEGSPFCKIAREQLCELEIPHIQISTPRGSPARQQMFGHLGRFQVPYLEDPNEGISLFESEAIIEYLQKKYGVVESPVEYF